MEYWISCDTFLIGSVEFPELFRITACFFQGGSCNVVGVAHTGFIWGLFLGFSHSVCSLPVFFQLYTLSLNCSLRGPSFVERKSRK